MVGAATTFKYVFDYKDEDVYWCTADCGWITGHSYVTYGGSSILLAEVDANMQQLRRQVLRDGTV